MDMSGLIVSREIVLSFQDGNNLYEYNGKSVFLHLYFHAEHFALNNQAAANNFIAILGADVIKMIGHFITAIVQLLGPNLMGKNFDGIGLYRRDFYLKFDLSIGPWVFRRRWPADRCR